MAKKLKGKQKDDKPSSANLPSSPAANQPHVVLTEDRPQQNAFGTTWGQGTANSAAGGAWEGAPDNVGGAWVTSGENVGETWGLAGGNLPQQQGSDDSSLGQSEILQPPPSHTPSVLATIPEQTPPLTPYNQNRRRLSDIGETIDEYADWPDSRTQHWGDNPQSHTLTATIAPSAMGSPPLQPTISLAEAAAVAEKERQKQGKTTTASEAARRLEESRRHSVDPRHLPPQEVKAHAVQQATTKKPKSSASAAAAAMEASHFKHPSAKQTDATPSQPGKTAWTHPKPFMEGGRDPAHIPLDPSWIHTGGNTWSRKHLASKSSSAVNWAQPIESPWPQPHHPYPPPPPQAQTHRPSHKKHHSHAGYPSHRSHRPSPSQQHQSWHSWGKDRWVESPGTETESEEDDAVNIVDSWGTYNSHHMDQRKGREKRSRRRKDDENENWQGGRPQQGKPAWGEQGQGGGHMDTGWGGSVGGDQWGGASGMDQWGGASGMDQGGQDKGGSAWGQAKGGGHSKVGSAWGQDNGNDWNQDANWGKDKGSGRSDPGRSQKQGGSGWAEQQASDTWGAATNAGGGEWGQTANKDWGRKLPSANEVPGGTRNAMSPQQISQIYNSFQNLPSQGQQHSKTMASKNNNQGIWEAESGWGSESDEEGATPRRVRFSPKASDLWGGSPRSVPSKAVAAAQQQGLTTTLINDTSTARFVESRGAGLAFVSNAFFGNTRLSRERIHWLFPQDKDQRISALLAWVQKMSFNLGTYGLVKFLEHRERGGLFVNAAFRMRQHPQEPAFDFLTFDQLQGTMDKTLQESVAFYDPARFAMAFVFLPSQSGNSVAIWRRKIIVPDSARQKYRAQIEAAAKSLRTPEEYIVMVDELPRKANAAPTHKPGQPRKLAKTANAKATSNVKQNPNAKKSRKWWKLFLS